MSTKFLKVVQTKPLPQGTSDFEEKRAALLQAFQCKVPLEYHLPQQYVDNPPTDVSGIPASCGILTSQELEITENCDAFEIAEAIASRRYTAVAVTTAFLKRSIIAHQLTCCLTQWLADEALTQAKELDLHLADTGKPVGPLHGVPISIKEHIPVRGTYSSQGSLASRVFNKEDCQMTAILRKSGAIFYCKTNQPQLVMHLESDSHWGRVLNPYNINLSAGGSTGGETALIALRGSVLGVGTDIGGSVRGPSAFCGIYGYKATSYTLPMNGFLKMPFAAELNVLCSTGPMCRSLRDLNRFMEVIIGDQPHLLDPRLIPLPWTGLKTPTNSRLKIGIVSNDGFIEPQPPVKRAIAWAKKCLSNSKYAEHVEIKDFTPFGAKEAWVKIREMYWPQGAVAVKDELTSTGEPIHPLTDWGLKDQETRGMLTALDIIRVRRERDDFRVAFAESWQKQDVDVILTPAFVGPACAHDTSFYWTYTSLYNLVDYPGVVFPTTIKAEAGEQYAQDYAPLSRACKHVKELWDNGSFENAPVNLQLVARKYHDNQLFGALALLKDILDLA